MGGKRNIYNILVRKANGKRPFVKHIGRWENNIKIDLNKVG
jgi:hypothetical protein